MLKSKREVEKAKEAIDLLRKASHALERAIMTKQNEFEVAAYLFDAQKWAGQAQEDILQLRSKYDAE